MDEVSCLFSPSPEKNLSPLGEYGVDLVDEDNAGRQVSCLLEQRPELRLGLAWRVMNEDGYE